MSNYLLLIHRDESKDHEQNWEQLGLAYEAFAAEAAQAGVLRGGEKLEPSPATSTVEVRDGAPIITAAPLNDSPLQLGGFFLLDCADREDAIGWATRCPGSAHGSVEVRPLVAV